MASTSSTSTRYGDHNKYVFDVFINHRGPDVKKTLATDLYNRLCEHGLRVFLDVEELQEGEKISPQIEGAIRTASVHIAIFSENYAESNWCLNELLLMLDSGSAVLPVFYHVKPSELRRTLGTDGVYARALRTLEEKKTLDFHTQQEKRRYDSDTIAKWRKALSDVAEISGFDLETYNGDEGQLLKRVVEGVLKKVRRTPLYVSKYPIGLDENVEDLQRMVSLEQQGGEVRVIGIVGLGGVGKTTLAKEIFNRERSKYKHSSFLFDIREKTLNSLQSDLLKDLTPLKEQIRQISSTDEGKEKLRNHLSCKEVLIILDNVDHAHQLDALLLPAKEVLHSSSLILVTSRDKKVLMNSDITKSSIYKLSCLNQQYSRELFCLHAFGQRHPVKGFKQLVKKFVDVCGGLPLSLTVLGALLRGNDLTYWTAQLRKISKILPNDIQSRLKISYDSLDEEEKQIFLDIACFFIGEDRDTAIRIWDGSGWEGWLSFRNLENKCVVEVDSENCIKMHDHLRDLGRDLAEKEPSECPNRFWRPTDNLLHLSSRPYVRGINMVDRRSGNSFGNPLALDNRSLSISRLELVRAEGDCLDQSLFSSVQSSNLIWLCWYSCPYYFLPRWIPKESLRVLHVEGSRLKTLWTEHKFQALLQLRELNILAPLLKIPKSIGKLKHLEKIVLHHGYLKTLPDEFCHLECLKHFELKSCSEIKSLPDAFGNLTKLKHIEFSECISLQMLPNSFGNLVQLKHLYLNKCHRLAISTETFGKISTLKCLEISGCSKIQVLPPQVEHNRLLRELCFISTNLKELPTAIGELTHLKYLILDSQLLKILPSSLGSLWRLQRLELLSSQLNRLPDSIGCLRSLKTLWIQSLKQLECLPDSIGNLGSLQELVLLNCSRLKCLPDSIGLLTQLTELSIEQLGVEYLPECVLQMSNLERLKIQDCPLSELPFREGGGQRETSTDLERRRVSSDLDNSTLKCMLGLKFLKVRAIRISEISFPEGICPNLRHLEIKDCHYLAEVGVLPITLTKVVLWNCSALRKIGGLSHLRRLQVLNVGRCFRMEELQGIPESLEWLNAFSCAQLKSIQGLAFLTKLRKLNVSNCYVLEELEGVEHLRSLVMLNASGCPKLQWGVGVAEQLRQRLKEGLSL